jgi:integrase
VWRLGELGDVLGDVPISNVLTGWARFKGKRCTRLAPATVDRFRDTLQAAINHAAREHGFEAPAISHVRYENERVRFLSKAQREALLAAYAPHVQPIALTLCFQGCRTQEALQLLWGDVDLDRETLWFGRTKMGIPRTVTMHPRVLAAIRTIHAARRPITCFWRLVPPYSDTTTAGCRAVIRSARRTPPPAAAPASGTSRRTTGAIIGHRTWSWRAPIC